MYTSLGNGDVGETPVATVNGFGVGGVLAAPPKD